MTDKTLVFLGGVSPEREVSRQSGEMVLSALRRQGIDAQGFDPAAHPVAEAAEAGGCVFNMLHGGAGENGEIQGALKMLKLPFTGSGVLGSALAMDKHRAKMMWRAADIPTPSWVLAASPAESSQVISTLGLPLFVKPSCGGSSTNASPVYEAAALPGAIAAALTEGAPAMIEQLVVGNEYTAAIVDGEVLPLIAIRARGAFYDYHAKYVSDETDFICPCGLSHDEEARYAEQSLAAFTSLGCTHWGRVDFIVGNRGVQFLEVNTVPGMTSHSLVPMAAAAVGVDYDALVRRIWLGAK